MMMALYKKSNQKIIAEFCKKTLAKWRETISADIVGVHFGKRYKGKKRINRYAIVFHVDKKLEHPDVAIPKTIKVKTPNGVLMVPTDVIETGRTRLASIKCGDKAYAISTPGDTGAVGLFFRKNNQWYICSNMHVLASQMLAQRNVYIPPANQRPDILCINATESQYACLERATFNGTDLAIARMQNQTAVENVIKGIGPVHGIINSGNIGHGYPLSCFGAFSNMLLNGSVENPRVSRIVQYHAIQTQIDDLIQTTLHASPGDSGSPVVGQLNAVAGIVVSIDNMFTYVIPAQDILAFVKPD